LISTMSSIMMSMNMSTRLYQQKLQQVNDYMRSKKLPPDLRDKVRDFYQLQFAEGKMFDEKKILEELGPSLRRDVLSYNIRDLFTHVPILKNSPAECVNQLAEVLQPMVSFAEDKIIVEGTSSMDMYFIYSGQCAISSKHQFDVKEPLITISTGCYFGDVAVFHQVKRSATVTATSVSILYVVSREDMIQRIQDHPLILEYMTEIARRRLRRVQFLDPNSTIMSLMPEEKFDEEDQAANAQAGTKGRRASLRSQVASGINLDVSESKKKEQSKAKKFSKSNTSLFATSKQSSTRMGSDDSKLSSDGSGSGDSDKTNSKRNSTGLNWQMAIAAAMKDKSKSAAMQESGNLSSGNLSHDSRQSSSSSSSSGKPPISPKSSPNPGRRSPATSVPFTENVSIGISSPTTASGTPAVLPVPTPTESSAVEAE